MLAASQLLVSSWPSLSFEVQHTLRGCCFQRWLLKLVEICPEFLFHKHDHLKSPLYYERFYSFRYHSQSVSKSTHISTRNPVKFAELMDADSQYAAARWMPPDSLLYTAYGNLQIATLIGASLSEPHTSMTALRMCVCMLAWPYTIESGYQVHINYLAHTAY